MTLIVTNIRISHSPVICSTEISINSRIARCHDDAPVILFLEERPRGLCGAETSFEMNVHDQIQILFGNFGETLIAQDARIVHQNINAAVILNGRLNDFIAIR